MSEETWIARFSSKRALMGFPKRESMEFLPKCWGTGEKNTNSWPLRPYHNIPKKKNMKKSECKLTGFSFPPWLGKCGWQDTNCDSLKSNLNNYKEGNEQKPF